ncbi:MAG: beta-lactamase family protein [Planctomycetales bacterium]|nr:beta-lactamase family protein [Planctomycetales bacterium]
MMRALNRRTVLFGLGAGCMLAHRLPAGLADENLEAAAQLLTTATEQGKVHSAALYVRAGAKVFTRAFGQVPSADAAFLLGSISKPVVIAALMTLYDQGVFDLEDRVQKYLPEFRGDQRSRVTVRHLLTHVSGLPDQLPHNATLRSQHAPLSAFVEGALRVPLGFEPGTKYEYSSMAILLAAEIGRRLAAADDIRPWVSQTVLEPLGMSHSALGVGSLSAEQMVRAQVEFGAEEAGGGSAESRTWDWNSEYWRQLGAPWGGLHASAGDVALFLQEFLHPQGKLFRPEVAHLMVRNHNPPGLESRGLGFDVGLEASCPGCSPPAFGHTGSTGTIAWADPQRDRLCVVLTSLPGRAMEPGEHPRQRVSDHIAAMGD